MEKDIQIFHIRRVQLRWGSLASLVFFGFALCLMLFDMPGALAAALAACLFWLVGVRWLRIRFRNHSKRMYALYGPGTTLKNVSYQPSQSPSDEWPARLGLTTQVSFLPNSICRHVLKGSIHGVSMQIAEVAFTAQPVKGMPLQTLTGTLIQAKVHGNYEFRAFCGEQLPLLLRGPYSGFSPCSPQSSAEGAPIFLIRDGQSIPQLLFSALNDLLSVHTGPIFACGNSGEVSVFLPRRFYAIDGDVTRDIQQTDFSPMPELDLTARIALAYDKIGNSSEAIPANEVKA